LTKVTFLDNVALSIDGVLYYQVVDPYKACYGVEDADFAITQLAQTTMRSEIGKLTLDKTLAERSLLNICIVEAINEAATYWGIKCLRYEIRDIQPPETVVKAMHSQVSAERQKRAFILESEGNRQSAINVAEGEKQSKILASEANKMEKINQALGEAEAIIARANATAISIEKVSQAIKKNGNDAVSLLVAEKYISAFSELAKKSTTLMLPTSVSEPTGAIAQAMTIFKRLQSQDVGDQQGRN
jgi:regulator of protease activity HflC (stomatin/prohibitin superfamily)